MKKSKVLSVIVFMFLITSCAESEETPVEVFYDDVTNEQMFLNIKNNDLDEIKRFVEINRKYLNIKDENGARQRNGLVPSSYEMESFFID